MILLRRVRAWSNSGWRRPLLPLRVVLDRNRGGAYMAMFLAAIGMFGVFLFLTYYLEDTLRYSAVRPVSRSCR